MLDFDKTLEDEGVSLGAFEKLLGDEYLRERAVAHLFETDMKRVAPVTDIEPAYYERVYKQTFRVGFDEKMIYFKRTAKAYMSKEEYIGIKLYKLLGGNTYERFVVDFDTGVFALSEVAGRSPRKMSLNYIQSKNLGRELSVGACIGLIDRYYENIKVLGGDVAQIDIADYKPFTLGALENSYKNLMHTVKEEDIKLDEKGFRQGMVDGMSIVRESFERNRVDIVFYLKEWERLHDGAKTRVMETVGQTASGKLIEIHEDLRERW